MSNAPTSEPLTRREDHLHQFLWKELQQMRDQWEALERRTPVPNWSWDDVKEALLELSQGPAEEFVIRGALSALMKEAQFKPPSLSLHELLRLAIAANDLGFQRSAPSVEADMP